MRIVISGVITLTSPFALAFSPFGEYIPSSSSSTILSKFVNKRLSSFTSLAPIKSNFYDDFEDFGIEDEDNKDEESENGKFNETTMAEFQSRVESVIDSEKEMNEDLDDEIVKSVNARFDGNIPSSINSVDDLITFATKSSKDSPKEWAKAIDISDIAKNVKGGVVLLANPKKFCSELINKDGKMQNTNRPNPALLAKFGLAIPPPAELGADRRADLLPVLILLERHPLRGCQALLMNRRTGYLMGDLDGDLDKLGAFMIQPLWFGGTSSGKTSASAVGKSSDAELGGGLDMIHGCPTVEDAKQLTDDGIFWGGDPSKAQDAMNDPKLERPMSGFDFKFFVQKTSWLPTQLEKEIRDGTWVVASASKEVLMKSRDRLGLKRSIPLWTEIMTLTGNKDILDSIYGDEA